MDLEFDTNGRNILTIGKQIDYLSMEITLLYIEEEEKLYSKAKAAAFRITVATWPLRGLKSVGYKSKLR